MSCPMFVHGSETNSDLAYLTKVTICNQAEREGWPLLRCIQRESPVIGKVANRPGGLINTLAFDEGIVLGAMHCTIYRSRYNCIPCGTLLHEKRYPIVLPWNCSALVQASILNVHGNDEKYLKT